MIVTMDNTSNTKLSVRRRRYYNDSYYYNYYYLNNTTTSILRRHHNILTLLVLVVAVAVAVVVSFNILQNNTSIQFNHRDPSIVVSLSSLSSLFFLNYVSSFQLVVVSPPSKLFVRHHAQQHYFKYRYKQQQNYKQQQQQVYLFQSKRPKDDDASSSNSSSTTTTKTTTTSNETLTSSSSEDAVSTEQQQQEQQQNSSISDEGEGTSTTIDTKNNDNNNTNNNKNIDNENTTIKEEIIYEFQLHGSINEITEDDWNRCIGHTTTVTTTSLSSSINGTTATAASPFLLHSWLRCLEDSGCVSAKTGWVPQHISIYEQKRIIIQKPNNNSNNNNTTETVTNNNTTSVGRLCGVIPMYIKGNSLGEFIFDQSFANAAYQMGIQYYPKLLIGIPFTPVTASKFNYYYDYDNNDTSDLEVGNTTTTTTILRRQRQYTYNRAIGEFLKQIAKSNSISSVHVNFINDYEATDLAGPLLYPNSQDEEEDDDDFGGIANNSNNNKNMALLHRLLFGKRNPELNNPDRYLRRTSLQYHWQNSNPMDDGKPFVSFDDYLACFKSKKRINIKRERRMVLIDQNITIHVITGQDILKYNANNNNKFIYRMYQIYVSTIEKMSIWGRQYLSYDFFKRIIQTDFVNYLVFICATKKRPGTSSSSTTTTNSNTEVEPFYPEDVFAGTINIVKDNVFYGRYWGCLPGNDIKNLHFETCYWSAIDYCIKNGIERMEPGAGGGDYKWARGFNPSLIHSVHYICDPNLRRMINQFLQYETEDNIELTEYLRSKSSVSTSSTSTSSSTSNPSS